MSENRGGCATCGQTFHDWEFWFDEFGRTRLDHRCDPADIARFQAKHELDWLLAKTVKLSHCEGCGVEMRITTNAQRFCHECASKRRHEKERLRVANAKAQRLANIAKAHEHPRCIECKRPQTRDSDRCSYHTRKWRIRTGQWDWSAA